MINLNNKFIYQNNYNNRSNRSFNKSNIYLASSSNNTSNNSIINILKEQNNHHQIYTNNSNYNIRKCIRDVDYESRFLFNTTLNNNNYCHKKDTIVKFNNSNKSISNNKQSNKQIGSNNNNYYCFCGDSNYSIDINDSYLNNNNDMDMNKRQKFSLKNKNPNILQAPFDQSTTASFISMNLLRRFYVPTTRLIILCIIKHTQLDISLFLYFNI